MTGRAQTFQTSSYRSAAQRIRLERGGLSEEGVLELMGSHHCVIVYQVIRRSLVGKAEAGGRLWLERS